MPKLEAVVILMEKFLKEIEFLVGDKFENVEELLNQRSFDVFSDDTLSFLSDISESLLNSPQIRKYPDVATFAFYCRKANLNLLKRNYLIDLHLRIGKGILFHITPGNVPVNFAYSLFAGLITGNINIVRVPSKDFEQVKIIVQAIRAVINEERYRSIFSKRLYIVKYGRDSSATSFFSSICDVRIIWGGDHTINDIRKSPISPKSTEVTFSDRYSISIISAYKYLKCENKTKLALDFYNDTYLFDQNACTSPQTIYWFGSTNEVKDAQTVFWKMLQRTLEEKQFEFQPILSVDKLTTFYAQAISYGDIEKEPQNSNEIWRVKNSSIHNDISLFKCSSGYFNEVVISSLDQLVPVISRKYQTIAYFGFTKEELEGWLRKNRPLGIDRIVPLGRTMDFSLIWDGYNLIHSLSRIVQIL
jgi:hypothetical protein